MNPNGPKANRKSARVSGRFLRSGSLRIVLAALFLFAFVASTVSLGQSGRPTPQAPKPQPPPQSQGRRPIPPASDDRPRRVGEEQQDEKPLKLKADLITVITSVTDPAGNQVNDLTEKDFELYEDNVLQDIAGLYREGQIPLRLIFLFDTSGSIRHRFDFEKRAASQFFHQVMRPGDRAALMSVSTDPKLELQLTPDVGQLVGALSQLKAQGATALYDAMIM